MSCGVCVRAVCDDDVMMLRYPGIRLHPEGKGYEVKWSWFRTLMYTKKDSAPYNLNLFLRKIDYRYPATGTRAPGYKNSMN